MVISLNTAEIKARLSELVSRVAFSHERLIVLRRGKPMAAMVSIEDLRLLEAMEANDAIHQGQNVHPVMRAYGKWADREDLDELVAEIYANREVASGREIEL